MNGNREKIIAFFIILLIVMIIIVTILLIHIRKQDINEQEKNNQEIGSSIVDEYGKNENNSITSSAYLDINTCMTEYLSILNINNSAYYSYDKSGKQVLTVEQNYIKQRIYNVLSQNYIEKNAITLDNIYDKVKTMKSKTMYIPLEAKSVKDGQVSSFVIHGLVENLKLEVVDEIFAIINIDIINNTFSVEPLDSNYNSITEINIDNLENVVIVKNDDNTFVTTPVSYEEIAKDYVNLYKSLALGSPEKLYDLLDKDYREARFVDLNEFETYIQKNKQEIMSIRVSKYQANKSNGYTQYVCQDQYGNTYVFKESAVMNYTVILDTYTIPLPEYIEKYNKASQVDRAALCINRFMEAVKDENYNFAYNVLSEGFKDNYFKTQNSFEQYIKSLENYSEIEYGTVSNQGELIIYPVTIKIGDKNIQKSFIVKLGEDINFELSFNVD